MVYHNHNFYKVSNFGEIISDSDLKQCIINEVVFSKSTSSIIFGPDIEGYCETNPVTLYRSFRYTTSYLDGIIIEYYMNIEEQNLERAFEYKYIGGKDWDSEYEKFKNLYTFDENVEINILNMTDLGDYKFQYRVEINYESGAVEIYDVLSEHITGMIGQIKTISVKQIK